MADDDELARLRALEARELERKAKAAAYMRDYRVKTKRSKVLKVPIAPRAVVEKAMAEANPVRRVPELQVGPSEFKPGSLAKKPKR